MKSPEARAWLLVFLCGAGMVLLARTGQLPGLLWIVGLAAMMLAGLQIFCHGRTDESETDREPEPSRPKR